MRRWLWAAVFAVACSDSSTTSISSPHGHNAPVRDGDTDDAAPGDLLEPADAAPSDLLELADSAVDAGASNACTVSGAPGSCILVSACTNDHTPYAGHCPGAADIQCCIVTPNPANNPPTPAGYKLMTQPEVTPAMTAWAVMILNDPTDYPMFATATMTFGAQPVLARVEWHMPDSINKVIHRGVTLYEPL